MSELARTMEEYARNRPYNEAASNEPPTRRVRVSLPSSALEKRVTAALAQSHAQPSELQTVLSNLEITRGLPAELVSALFSRSEVLELAQGTSLLTAGQPNAKMFIVLSGELHVHLPDHLGTPIAVLRVGDTVGELSVIDQRPVSATVIASQISTLLVVDEPTFWRTIHTSHAFAVKLMLKLADRLRANNTTVQAKMEMCAELTTMALFDALTNVHSRRWLDETLPRLRDRHRQDQKTLSLLVVDVDHFKRVNDTYGHQTGDAVLVAIADALRMNVRPTDFVARYGGEEFVVILPHAPLDGALIAAERIRAAVQNKILGTAQGTTLPGATVSIGVAEVADDEDIAAWIGRADSALYRAKHHGRNRVEAAFTCINGGKTSWK